MKPQQFGQTDYERRELRARRRERNAMIAIPVCLVIYGLIRHFI